MLKIENSTSKLVTLQRDIKRHREMLINTPIGDETLKDSYFFESIRKIKNEMKILIETADFY